MKVMVSISECSLLLAGLLGWTPAERSRYVYGYIDGYSNGSYDTCKSLRRFVSDISLFLANILLILANISLILATYKQTVGWRN